MRVAVNARALCTPTLRGWSRYTINLLAEMPSLGVELYLYADHPVHEDHLARLPQGTYRVRVAPSMPYIAWEQYWVPQQAAADRIHLLHAPFNFGLPWASCCPRVLTLHDAIGQSGRQHLSAWLQRLNRESLQTRMYHWVSRTRAHRVITVSEHSRGDLVKHLGIESEKISVIYEDSLDQLVHGSTKLLLQQLRKIPETYTYQAD